MQAAQQAMDKAKTVFAEDLAPSDWKEAIQAWEQGQGAVKEGKPSVTFFKRAKSRFEKTYKVAKANSDTMSQEVSSMQATIGERFAKVKSELERRRIPAKLEQQVKPMIAEIQEGTATVDTLASQGNYLKARTLARELQTKVYNAELIVSGKKPK